MSLSEPFWRIVFFGTPSFAVPTLERLYQGPDQVMAVVTQPDRGKGRGQKVLYSPVKEAARRNRIPLFQPEKVREEAFQEEIKKISSDLFVVVAFGQLLPKSLLGIPKFGAINVHASLLPSYRGAAPVQWAILNDEKATGVTTIMMDEGMDTGDILLQREVTIGERENAETLHGRLSFAGAELLSETIERMKSGRLHPVKQNHSVATSAPVLRKEDGRIDWKKDARAVDCLVRGLFLWPGACTYWEEKLLKVFGGEGTERESGGIPGTVLWVCPEFIEVKSGKGSFLIREVQLEGKRRMKVKEFLLGHPIPVGTILK
jgi:methionyl-tRNA formyltransferase